MTINITITMDHDYDSDVLITESNGNEHRLSKQGDSATVAVYDINEIAIKEVDSIPEEPESPGGPGTRSAGGHGP